MKKHQTVLTGVFIGAALMITAGVYSRTTQQQRGPQPGLIKPEMGDTITATVYADNWFAMYINGKLVAIDPIDFLPHNVVKVDILPEYPMTIAIVAKDNADPKTGYEYGNRIGDAGIVVKFSDGTVSNAAWKVQRISSGPPVKTIAFPTGWELPSFDDSKWEAATVYSTLRVNPKKPYYDFDFMGASFVWTTDLDTDNTILLRTKVEKQGWNKRWNTKPDLDISGAHVKS
jgi:hypothetical protein